MHGSGIGSGVCGRRRVRPGTQSGGRPHPHSASRAARALSPPCSETGDGQDGRPLPADQPEQGEPRGEGRPAVAAAGGKPPCTGKTARTAAPCAQLWQVSQPLRAAAGACGAPEIMHRCSRCSQRTAAIAVGCTHRLLADRTGCPRPAGAGFPTTLERRPATCGTTRCTSATARRARLMMPARRSRRMCGETPRLGGARPLHAP